VLSPSQSPQQPAAFRCPHPGPDLNHAMIESFWSRMQIELLDRHRWRTRIELANAIFEYLEIFHNRQRRHSSLGMLSPIEFETANPPPSHEESSSPTPQDQGQTPLEECSGRTVGFCR
jgi:hypothetical protein